MEPRAHLHAGLKDLDAVLPAGWSVQSTEANETEFFAALPGGILEVGGKGDSVSVAFDSGLWEDLPLVSIRDADRVLAACDAIIEGRVSERSSGWLVKSIVTSLQLSTRGFDERVDDHTIAIAGIGNHGLSSEGSH